MADSDVREPRRDDELGRLLGEAAPPSPFSDADVTAVEARILKDGASLIKSRRRGRRLRSFAYRVALPMSLAAELIIAIRLVAPPEPDPAERSADAEFMDAVAVATLLESDLGSALLTGSPFGLALGSTSASTEENDG
ncbi:MAG: hypothetical protein HKN72_01375 [Gemmatimonadetes bacterium]|nr:hypothetical protein [Gemmatimonadota bacterium]